MKKVGIMSMQRIVNYGSFLQAYGLKKMIESLGYSVEFIDFKFERSLLKKRFKDTIIYKVFTHLNIPYHIKKRKFMRQFEEKYQEYLKMIKVDKYNYNKNIDTLVIGSDEVFNCTQGYPVGYSRNLFGYEYEDKNVISYAASFGYTTLEKLEEYSIEKEIKNLFLKFKALSVRDFNSYKIIESLTNIHPIINLDPVLVSDYSIELENNKNDFISDYIVVYAYTGRLTKNEEKFIKNFAKKYNKKIVSLGFYQRIADYNLIVNPFSILNYIKNADYVITDTFHGAVFSVKMNTKFCAIIRNDNYNKLSYLLKIVKHEKQIVHNINDIEKLYNAEISFIESNNILEKESIRTIEYLKKNI